MALDPKLLEILACPEDKGPLLYFEDEQALYNPRLSSLRATCRRVLVCTARQTVPMPPSPRRSITS